MHVSIVILDRRVGRLYVETRAPTRLYITYWSESKQSLPTFSACIDMLPFEGGLAYVSETKYHRDKKGFIDLNGNIVLEFKGVARVEFFRVLRLVAVFADEHEAVPWLGISLTLWQPPE